MDDDLIESKGIAVLVQLIDYQIRRSRSFHSHDYEQYKEKFRLTKIASLEKVLKRLKNDAA
jgi:hypothetical protein